MSTFKFIYRDKFGSRLLVIHVLLKLIIIFFFAFMEK